MEKGLQLYEWAVLLLLFFLLSVVAKQAIQTEDREWGREGKKGEWSRHLIVVFLSGEVRNVGVYHVLKGKTLGEFLEEVELKEDADLSSLSLEKPLRPSQRVRVPKKKGMTKKGLR